jgi:hypothetical protein
MLRESVAAAIKGWKLYDDKDGSKTDVLIRGMEELTNDKSPTWSWDTGITLAWARKL